MMEFDPLVVKLIAAKRLDMQDKELEAEKLASKVAHLGERLTKVEIALAKLVKLLGYVETK